MAQDATPRRATRTGYHEAIHLLNQRYHEQWQRAERLQGELAAARAGWLGWALAWLRWGKRLVKPARYTGRPGTHAGELSRVAFERVEEMHEVPVGLVSVIIPFRDQLDLLRGCIRSLRRLTDREVELVLVDNDSQRHETRRYLKAARRRGVTVVECPGAFNFSRVCNAGAHQARGEFLLFLNNDIEALHGDWLERMLGVAGREDVGITGATLLYPDRTIQHAGLFPRGEGRWVHGYRGLGEDATGDQGELDMIRTVPAVTGACLMIRRETFAEVGGFDESLPISYGDVELCVRVNRRGKKVVITPHAKLMHYEAVTRGYTSDTPNEEHLGALARFPRSG